MPPFRAGLREVTRSHSMRHFDVTFESATRVSENFTRVRITSEHFDTHSPVAPADAFKLSLIPQNEANLIRRVFQMRALTVRDFDHSAGALDFDVATHPGVIKRWLDRVSPGDVVTFYGFRHEWVVDDSMAHAIFAGDTSALPAIAAILDSLPDHWTATAVVATHPGDRPLIAPRSGVDVHWTDDDAELLPLLRELPAPAGASNVWIAAEAGITRELRHHATSTWGVSRDDLHAAAYWKR